jgi:putative cell wall-binding protein
VTVTGTTFSHNGWAPEDLPRGVSAPSWATAPAATVSIDAVVEPPGEPIAVQGGGMAVFESEVTISGCSFEWNVALDAGGGLMAGFSALDVDTTTFASNYAWSGEMGDGTGGGVAVLAPRETSLLGCTFDDNFGFWGGGVFLTAPYGADLSACDFNGNLAWVGDGVLYAPWDFVQTPDSADVSAQGVIEPIPLDVDSCTFTENGYVLIDEEDEPVPADAYAAFATIYGGPVKVTNSVFARNAGLAAFLVDDAPVDMFNCTFADNMADAPYVGFFGSGVADSEIHNSIFWGNYPWSSTEPATAFGGKLPAALAGLADKRAEREADATEEYFDVWDAAVDYSDLEHGVVSETQDRSTAQVEDTNISEDPLYTEPGSDYSLQYGSPCIDTGSDIEDRAPGWDILGSQRPIDGDGDGVALWDMGAYEAEHRTPFESSDRVAGSDRYATAVAISRSHFEAADTVVVVRGDVFADGLTSSGLAGLYGSPLLLTQSEVMPEIVSAEIERLGATRAFVVGGTQAVSGGVEDQLAAMGLDVARIGGANRYETAALIAERIEDEVGTPEATFIARGDLFADALTVSPVAYAINAPILLVGPNDLPEATVGVLEDMAPSSVVIAGGPAAISPSVQVQIAGAVDLVDRVQGDDRYATSAAFSRYAADAGWAAFSSVGVATGESFPDALSGGCAVGSMGGVLMLTPSASLDSEVRAALTDFRADVTAVEVFGGLMAVSDAVLAAIDEALAP